MNWTITAIAFFALAASAQIKNSDVVGVWKGTSLCMVKGSPCHDEIFFFNDTATTEKKGRLKISANKIVNGQEEWMGDLDCDLHRDKSTVSCDMKGKPVWQFAIQGDSMSGTLVLPDGTLYRKVEVKREKN